MSYYYLKCHITGFENLRIKNSFEFRKAFNQQAYHTHRPPNLIQPNRTNRQRKFIFLEDCAKENHIAIDGRKNM